MKSNTTIARVALLLSIASCGSCSSENPGDTPDAADAPVSDAAAEDAPGGACPTAPGPKMVWVPWPAQKGGGYCIDSTEVTSEQYAAFVAANVDPATQAPQCAWNTSFDPPAYCLQNLQANPSPNLPQTCVDWCDSDTFCRWAGKRLCGGTPEKTNDATTSEWYNACSAGGTRLRPYGDEHKPYCNVRISTGGEEVLKEVGVNPACEGGYAGILDMLGNAVEWTGECMAVPGGDGCRFRGSNFLGNWPNEFDPKNARDNPLCADPNEPLAPIFSGKQGLLDASAGFRCCADEVK